MGRIDALSGAGFPIRERATPILTDIHPNRRSIRSASILERTFGVKGPDRETTEPNICLLIGPRIGRLWRRWTSASTSDRANESPSR